MTIHGQYLGFKGTNNILNTYAQCHDIGASVIALSSKRQCRISTEDQGDQFIYLPKGVINNASTARKGFKDENDFINKIAQRILFTHRQLFVKEDQPKELGDKSLFKLLANVKQAPKLEELAVFIPSVVTANPETLEPNFTPYISNAKKMQDGKLVKLEHVNYNQVITALKAQKDVPISEDLGKRTYFLNDLLGAGVKVAEDIACHPELILTENEIKLLKSVNKGKNEDSKENIQNPLEGFKAMVVMNGGGTGISIIEFMNNEAIVKSPEGCHDIALKMPEEGAKTIDIATGIARPPEAGAAVRSILDNFCENIGISGENKKIIKESGLTQLVTEGKIALDSSSEQGRNNIELLRSAKGLFDEQQSGNEIQFSFKDEQNGEKFKKARNKTIEQYAYIMGELAFASLNRGENALIVAGPLASGINKIIQQNPKDFKGKSSLGELIEDKMMHFAEDIVHDGKSIEELKKYRRYRVICGSDNKFNIKDNTEGAKVILDKRTEVIRGMWGGNTIRVPLDVLNGNYSDTCKSLLSSVTKES